MMTEEEYREARKEIIRTHGEPEYLMRSPENESARLLLKLRAHRANDFARQGQLKGSDEKISDRIEELATRSTREGQGLEFLIKESDLDGYSAEERLVIKAFLPNLKQRPSDLARKLGLTQPRVTGILTSMPVKFLLHRLKKELLSNEAFISAHAALKKGDTRIAIELLRDSKLLNADEEGGEAASTRIYDPVASAALKALGDALVTRPEIDIKDGPSANVNSLKENPPLQT